MYYKSERNSLAIDDALGLKNGVQQMTVSMSSRPSGALEDAEHQCLKEEKLSINLYV